MAVFARRLEAKFALANFLVLTCPGRINHMFLYEYLVASGLLLRIWGTKLFGVQIARHSCLVFWFLP